MIHDAACQVHRTEPKADTKPSRRSKRTPKTRKASTSGQVRRARSALPLPIDPPAPYTEKTPRQRGPAKARPATAYHHHRQAPHNRTPHHPEQRRHLTPLPNKHATEQNSPAAAPPINRPRTSTPTYSVDSSSFSDDKRTPHQPRPRGAPRHRTHLNAAAPTAPTPSPTTPLTTTEHGSGRSPKS